MSTLLSIAVAALVSLLVLRWKRDDLDPESRDALAREEVRHRASLARWIVAASVASLGIGVALPVASLGIVTYGVVRMTEATETAPSAEPAARIASAEATRLRAEIERIEAHLAEQVALAETLPPGHLLDRATDEVGMMTRTLAVYRHQLQEAERS